MRRHLIGVDGLRGIAALTVLFHHVGQHTTDEDTTGLAGRVAELMTHGLTLFFVLSGFLLFRPFAAAILNDKPLPSIRQYIVNRFFRIVPAYVVIFLFVALVIGIAYTEGTPSISQSGNAGIGRITDPGMLVANLFLVQSYIPQYVITGIGPAWSLTAEIAFYIALPLLAILAAIAARRINRLLALLVAPGLLIAVGLITTYVISRMKRGMSGAESVDFSWGQNWSAVLDRSILAQADLFGYGMLAAIAYLLISRRVTTPAWWKPVGLATVLVLVVIPISVSVGAFPTSVYGIAAALLLFIVVLPSANPERRGNVLAVVLEWRVVRFLGEISYSVYLWHVPVIGFYLQRGWLFGTDLRGLFLNALLVAVTAIALATVTYYVIEKPALTLKNRLRTRPIGRDLASGGEARTGGR